MIIVELITDLYSRGGAEVFLVSFCKELKKTRPLDEIHLVSIWEKVHDSFKVDIESSGVFFHDCGKKSSGDFIAPSIRLKKLLKRIKPDIVHTHRNVFPSYFLAFGFKKTRWRVFHTVHNVAMNESTNLGKKLLAKYIKKRIVYPIGISNEITKSISNYYSLPINSISTIYNGIDLARKDNFNCNEATMEYDMICVARFDNQKNHLFLLRELNKYILHNNPHIKLALLGSGQLKSECEHYVSSNNMSKNVIFLGEKENPYPFLYKSRIFVLPSLYEGNPICILEAMNAGLPILASRVGGIPDIVKDEENGFLFEINNGDDFLSKLHFLLSDLTVINKMKINNIQQVQKYSINHCVTEYSSLFEMEIKK